MDEIKTGRVETVEVPENLYLKILKIVSQSDKYNTVTDFVVDIIQREIYKLLPQEEE